MNKKIFKAISAGLILIGVILILAVRQAGQKIPAANQTGKVRVVTSFYPLYFFTTAIGADKVSVINITPAGAEPHDYEPTAQDIARIETSRLLVINGGGLEAWGNHIEKNLDATKTSLVIAGEGLTNQQLIEDGQARIDPHVWLAPVLAEQIVDKITQGLVQVDPVNQVYYQANAEIIKSKLADMDKAYKQGLSKCTVKDIITSHAAFGYLASAYGLKQVSIAGLSPDAEPSPQQLAGIVNFAKAKRVGYIFFESLVSPKLAETIAAEVGAKTLVLNPIESLSNKELNQGKTYLTEMESNLTNLKIALQCQ